MHWLFTTATLDYLGTIKMSHERKLCNWSTELVSSVLKSDTKERCKINYTTVEGFPKDFKGYCILLVMWGFFSCILWGRN